MPLVLCSILLTLAAVDPPPASSEPIQIVGNRRYYGRPFISPMGEPFRAKVPHDDPEADWFRQADRNHDGYLTPDEMVQDAARFFEILDTNHNGVIDPDEIQYYEEDIAPEVGGEPADLRGPAPSSGSDSAASSDTSGGDPDYAAGQYATRVSGGGGDDRSPSGAGRYALLNIPEPVTGADTDLNGLVTQSEFRRAALRRFQLLDASHSGRLTLSLLER
jgi:hypothetical protein